MRNNIFKKLFLKNGQWFMLEIIGTYVTAIVLLLGNGKISDAIDAMFNGNLSEIVNEKFWIYVAILIVAGFTFTYLQNISAKIFSSNMQTGFRRAAGQQLFRLQFQYFDTHASGKVLNNFLDDVRMLSEYYSEILPIVASSVITIGTIMISLFRLDIVLTLILMVMVPLMILVSRFTGKRVSDLTKKFVDYNDELSELAYDSINGIGVVKSYNLENYFKGKIQKTNKKLLRFAYRRNEISALAFMTGQVLDYAPQIILGLVAIVRVAGGHLSIGEMSYFMLLLDRVVHPLAMLPNYIIEGKICLVSKKRLEELMDYPIEQENVMDNQKETDEIMSFENVTFSYNENTKVLNGINLCVQKGKNIAFVGESGGGKSTIIKLICGYYALDSGKLRLFGRNINEWNLDCLRRKIAIVTQVTFLFPETIAWNVACGDDRISIDKIMECCIKAGIHDEIMKMPEKYETNVGERGDRLSGGQKQRIAIARALLKDAELILFDEPTASIDIENEEKIKEVLRKISADHTIITIAHRLNTIISADCIHVFKNGRIVESGKHEELIRINGAYSKLYHISEEAVCE
ncbi:ABC transporter ATP-binding protein [[Clostridium] fimetarium]|uniref:ATP-binding cassette, subfamily B, MsbA/ATP-binding cassette, subfamily B, AbcA/BmrA n=1 Tax=[Clostridium] fimetarium TaxID=99656 RepID=A0A1I0R1K0_9FIRM|nr:ABC transporter ATP-binding protein [[Clostridium] fimetarium]SEW33508.1 ATP-binding cassette, subfamily B, MsbA/ATP-binding cassette, subfamily B, AbcA/BmrA [[Clostridium] fimetarium]